MQERRKWWRRKDRPVSVTFRTVRTPDREESAVSLDLSSGGVSFAIPLPLALGTLLELEVVLPFDSLPLQASGRVNWVRDRFAQGVPVYEVGIEFVQMSSADRERLGQYLQSPERQAS